MNPDELLSQIADLMQQYLSLGENTPAYDAVSAALPDIQAAAGGGAEDPSAQQDPGAPPDPSAGLADQGGPPPEGDPASALASMMPTSKPKSFADASSQALDQMKKRKSKAA